MQDSIIIEFLEWIEEYEVKAEKGLQRQKVGRKEPYELGFLNGVSNCREKFTNLLQKYSEVKMDSKVKGCEALGNL